MAIITLLTDFGLKDHYVAAVKAKILSINPGIQIVDLSHEVPKSDLAYGSYVLKSVYREFPRGTVHLYAIDDAYQKPNPLIAVKTENYVFIGADNGFLGLVTDASNYLVTRLHSPENGSTFVAKDVLAPMAAQIASGKDVTMMGSPQESFKKMLNRHMRLNQEQIIGQVIHVDTYGNLITNIEKAAFDKYTQGKSFFISFGRENSTRINAGYHSVDPGECFVIFNSLGLLEIGIKQGNASQLLGLQYDSNIVITYK